MPDQQPTSQPPPLFYRRLPFLQLLLTKQSGELDRYYQGVNASWGHYHQMMVLAGGIVGVVIPILATQKPSWILPFYSKAAAISFALTLVVGALIQAVGRWLTAGAVISLDAAHREIIERVWLAGEDEGAMWTAAYSGPKRTLVPLLVVGITVGLLGAVADILFYGFFILGVITLVFGAVLK